MRTHKKGFLFLFLLSMVLIFSLPQKTVSASEEDSDVSVHNDIEQLMNEELDQELIDIFNELDNYTLVDENGLKTIDLVSAEQNNASEEIIEIGTVMNSMAKDVDKDNSYKNTEEIVLYSLFPIGSYGNYCGKGNNGYDKTPIDNLDSACRAHDKCFNGFFKKNTTCNQAFIKKLLPIVQSERFSKKGIYAFAAIQLFK
jgi:hypothetical protein